MLLWSEAASSSDCKIHIRCVQKTHNTLFVTKYEIWILGHLMKDRPLSVWRKIQTDRMISRRWLNRLWMGYCWTRMISQSVQIDSFCFIKGQGRMVEADVNHNSALKMQTIKKSWNPEKNYYACFSQARLAFLATVPDILNLHSAHTNVLRPLSSATIAQIPIQTLYFDRTPLKKS